MNEHASILYCLRKIEDKMDWKPSSEWTDHDFKLLKQEIYDCSNISISTHTLKRLFGKIKYKAGYTPQHATKDALAQFIGFDSWEDFVRASEREIGAIANGGGKHLTPVGKGPGRRKRILYWTLAAAGLCIIALAVVKAVRNRSLPEFSFSVENPEGIVPHTVTFRYDVSEIRTDPVFIDFDFVHPILGGEFVLMNRNRSMLNHTYQIPGVYHPKLMMDNRALDSAVVVAKTNSWVTFFQKDGEKEHWMDDMLQDLNYRDYLTISRSDIDSYGFDSTGIYYTTHRNIRDFGLSADNFKLETRFVNGPANGGISCYDSNFRVIGELSDSYLRMVEENCHQFCRIKFGELNLHGQTSDLTSLSRDLFNWNILRIEVVDKQVEVFFNGEAIFETSYTAESGDIVGLETRFKGSGMVDYMLLTNLKNDTVYYSDFR